MPTRDQRIAEGLDVAWIIELWKALHGADCDSQAVAIEAMAALQSYLEISASTFLPRQVDSQAC